MHYAVLVITDESEHETVAAAVESVLSRYENIEWDWFQIGGRWTGFFDGYDPEKDPANIKPCDICNATGTRSDEVGIKNGFTTRKIEEEGHPRNGETGWCNGCNGTGKRVEWPTQWAMHDGDTIPIDQLTAEHLTKVHAVLPDGWRWCSSEEYIPWAEPLSAKFKAKDLPPLEWLKTTGTRVTIVDCHN